MSDDKKLFVKPDVSAPLQKRSSYLKISEDEPLLVTVDLVEEIQLKTDVGIKEAVRVSCREVIVKRDGNDFSYSADQETKIKESYSTSTWYLLKDFQNASHWPKEGIYYWVWKAEDGLRWEEA
jgi:hypothetical protein